MRQGDIPFRTIDDAGAVDRAKAFCASRKLTPDDVKLTRKDGWVMVVVKRNGVSCHVPK